METIADRVRRERERLGLSQAELARLAGNNVKQQNIQQLEAGETKSPRYLLGLAYALGVSARWLQSGGDRSEHILTRETALERAEREAGEVPTIPSLGVARSTAIALGDLDLPVYGTARGGPEGTISVGTDPVEYVRRPEPLLKVPSGFGVILYGDSMEPVFRQGDILLVHPSKIPTRDDDALFVKEDAHGAREAIVKRLVGWTSRVWKVAQFNPKSAYEISRADWQTAMKIVGMYRR